MNSADLTSLVSKLAHSPVGKYNAILTSRTIWFGKIINYFLPQSGVSVRSTIDKIQSLINKDPSVLKQSTFIKDAIQVTNKLDAYIYTLFNHLHPDKERFLSFVRLLERCILTCISNDQIKNPEVIQSIQSRLAPGNILSYLRTANSNQNIPLATACCAYMGKNSMINELINENPKKIIPLLNAGCLAKNDLIIKKIWEIICLNNLEIFKVGKVIPALGYLINKKEFSNQTLIVGDLQNPQKVLVNREILSQRSRYFHTLFHTTLGSQTTITLKDQDHTTKLQSIDYKGFLHLLHYIYTGIVDVPLDLCLTVSHLADLYLEPDLKKTCDKKKWDQAVLALEHKNLTGKFQNPHCEEFFYLVHKTYTGKTDISSVITLKNLIEELQNIDYQAILYLLHYIYTSDEDVPLNLCSDVSHLADNYSEPDLKKACDQKILQSCI